MKVDVILNGLSASVAFPARGIFMKKDVAGQTIVDLRNVPSGMGNLSLPQNFLLLTKYLLVICIFLQYGKNRKGQ